MNVEGLAADNIDHRTPVQIVEFFRIAHDEESRPKLPYLLLGERNTRDSEGTEFIPETAEPLQHLRCCNRHRHDRWLLQPAWRHIWKTQPSRKDKMPHLKDPGRQVFVPSPACPSLPVC